MKSSRVFNPEVPVERWAKLNRRPNLSPEFRSQIRWNLLELKTARRRGLSNPLPAIIKATVPILKAPEPFVMKQIDNFLSRLIGRIDQAFRHLMRRVKSLLFRLLFSIASFRLLFRLF